MFKIKPTVLAVSDTNLIKGRKVIATFADAETADEVYETMVAMHQNAKAHGTCDAAIVGGAVLMGVGLLAKAILTAKDLRK